MMKKTRLVVAAFASLAVVMTPAAAAFANDHEFHTTLDPLNDSGGSGMATVTVDGDEATVELSWSGLAETFQDGPYPHVQHIHIGNEGTCPDPSADENGDGIVDTVEGQPAYGMIGTTLSTEGDTSAEVGTDITIAPGGGSTDYERTFTLNQETKDALSSGTGVVVVHGLDPTTLSEEAANAPSNLVPELPLAATAPALCGALDTMPAGGVDTGEGSTSGVENAGLFVLGGVLLTGGAGAAVIGWRRRSSAQLS